MYKRIAKTIEDMDQNIIDMQKSKNLDAIPGMGKDIKRLITEFMETGQCRYLEELKG